MGFAGWWFCWKGFELVGILSLMGVIVWLLEKWEKIARTGVSGWLWFYLDSSSTGDPKGQ